ncbi:MAG: GerMN domain-containing protein [Lachnospiraceae bacterium]|nr:GerMN domain-containing protein [Lachnospiraceae bacterium]
MRQICIKSTILLLLAAALAVMAAGCGKKDAVKGKEKKDFLIYFVNEDKTELVAEKYIYKGSDSEDELKELTDALMEGPKDNSLKSPADMGVEIQGVTVEGTLVTVSFSKAFSSLDPADRILVCASVVKTLIQAEGAEGVSITIEGSALVDRFGNPVGVFGKDSFLTQSGMLGNGEGSISVRLYFADESGRKLESLMQKVEYSANETKERMIVGRLIAGPDTMGYYPTVPQGTKVNSINVTDGVCYLDLSKEFLSGEVSVSPEVTVYSIVNSLAEVSGVRKVKILVDGKDVGAYRDSVDLSGMLSRDLSLLED